VVIEGRVEIVRMGGRSLSNPARAMPARLAWTPAALAAGMGLVAFVAGLAAESAIIRAVHGNRPELEWLSDAFISTAVAGLTYLWLHLRASRLRVLTLEREQIAVDEQLRLAAEIQRSLLPTVPPATAGLRWAAQMVPAGRVGGDFYDFFRTADGAVMVIVVDVSGKGIPAALILSSLKMLFRGLVHQTADPAVIAERISTALYEEHAGSLYATGIVARFETAPGRLTYVNAGHPAGFLLRHGRVALGLESGGRPLGLLPGETYGAASVDLYPGDIGVLVTDGITEALGPGPVTLGQALGAWPERRSPAEICDELIRVAGEGPGPADVPDWEDDRTVFTFAFEPEPQGVTAFSAPTPYAVPAIVLPDAVKG
jgi:Stage II sporulation protein E (SpoIIE)